MKRILLIEDDPVLKENIKDALTAEKFSIESISDGVLAEKALAENKYDCIILDINLPRKSGFEICENFRKINDSTPIIMLTAYSELDDKIKGYESGADDYLTKPFFMRELLLRIDSLLKRAESNNSNKNVKQKIEIGDLTIDSKNKAVTRQGKKIELTPREFQILLRLVNANGELVTKKELITEIWGKSFDANTNTIEVYINFLRNKIDKPFSRNSIKTKVGFGYYYDAV